MTDDNTIRSTNNNLVDSTSIQNIEGSMPVNDITGKVIYLIEQFGRQSEQLKNIQHSISNLDDNSKHLEESLNNRIESLNTQLNNRIENLDTRLSGNVKDLTQEITKTTQSINDKIDTNLKWIIAAIIIPIISLLVDIFIKK